MKRRTAQKEIMEFLDFTLSEKVHASIGIIKTSLLHPYNVGFEPNSNKRFLCATPD